MPPLKGDHWVNYTSEKSGGAVDYAVCKRCKKWRRATRNKEILITHSSNCKAPIVNDTTTQSSPAREAPATPSIGDKRKAQEDIGTSTRYVDRSVPIQHRQMDRLLAAYIFEEGLPLSTVERPAFKRFLESVKPAYRAPTRKELSTDLLHEGYQDLRQEVNAKLAKAQRLTLVSDGWTNTRNEALINYLVGLDGVYYFYKSVCTGSNRHTSEHIAAGLQEVITELGSDKVVSLTTDNASNMRRAWRILKQTNRSLITMGCCSHRLNLLGNDIVKSTTYKDIFAQAVQLAKFFKKRAGATAAVKEELGRSNGHKDFKAFAVPNNTRWQGKLHMIRALLNNFEAIQRVLTSKEWQEYLHRHMELKDLYTRVLTTNLKQELEALQSILEPLLKFTIALESEQSRLSSCWRYFYHLGFLSEQAPIAQDQELKNIFRSRLSQAYHPLMALAWIADIPLRRSKSPLPLKKSNIVSSVQWLVENNLLQEGELGDTLLLFMRLQDFQAPFDNAVLLASALPQRQRALTPLEWWDLWEDQVPNSFIELCKTILSVPPTSGAAERNWSAYGSIHSATRNRLSNDKAEMLVYMQHNLRMKSDRDNRKDKKAQELDDYLQDYVDTPPERAIPGVDDDNDDNVESLDDLGESQTLQESQSDTLLSPPLTQLSQDIQNSLQAELERMTHSQGLNHFGYSQ